MKLKAEIEGKGEKWTAKVQLSGKEFSRDLNEEYECKSEKDAWQKIHKIIKEIKK